MLAEVVLLGLIGVYGALVHEVRRRRRELGIRIALGAAAADLRRAVLRRGASFLAAGLGARTFDVHVIPDGEQHKTVATWQGIIDKLSPQGVQRERVHHLLKRNPFVKAFRLAPPEAGGWGATLVELAPPASMEDF